MKVTAILANHVEAQNNLLYVAGGGIDHTFVPAGAIAPFAVTVGLGVLVRVSWTDTNEEHLLSIELVDPDNRIVLAPGADGPQPVLRFETGFTVGRPATLRIGDEQGLALAVNMPGLVIPQPGDYAFVVSIDGEEEDRVHYTLAVQPG